MIISFEKLEHSDHALVARWLSDPEINRWLVDWRDKKVSERVISIVAMSPHNEMFLVSKDGIKCGLLALGDIDREKRTADFWYLLGEQQMSGQGIMSTAAGQFMEHCFSQLDLDIVTAQVMSSNIASIRLLEKNKFESTGLINNGEIVAGEDSPRIGMALKLAQTVRRQR